MSKRDPPECRPDLVCKAAQDGVGFQSAFDWINEKQERIAQNNPANRGLEAWYIRDLARDWVIAGNKIKCVPEKREPYKDERHFHYDIIVTTLDDFPRGLYVEMDLASCDEDVPTVRILNAHPP